MRIVGKKASGQTVVFFALGVVAAIVGLIALSIFFWQAITAK